MGGLVIAQWTAKHLDIPVAFTECEVTPENVTHLRKPFGLHRGFGEWIAGHRVLLVDDIVSTGYSVCESMKSLGAAKEIIGVATLITRGNVDDAGLQVDHFISLAEVRIPSWPEAKCPSEILARPVNTRYAHGAEYLAGRRD